MEKVGYQSTSRPAQKIIQVEHLFEAFCVKSLLQKLGRTRELYLVISLSSVPSRVTPVSCLSFFDQVPFCSFPRPKTTSAK